MLGIFIVLFALGFVWGLKPSRKEAAYRRKVRRARDEFYLREAARAEASRE